jgi:acetyl-CoA carboxylase biotin carboxyl carrier protein
MRLAAEPPSGGRGPKVRATASVAAKARGGAHPRVPAGPVTGQGPATSLIDLRLIDELARLLSEYQLAELEVERGGDRVRLRRGPEPGTAALPIAAPPPSAPPPLPAGAAPPAPADDPTVAYITSPFVGTFYRSPSPDAPPYVDVGARVQKGQVLCIVEAMKLMNEIESEVDGTVVDLLVANGQPVEYGQQLYKIRR